MESAELVKKKRIRHAYPRKEIYHRFVHSSEYAYSPSNSRYQICCIGNYLIKGNIGKYHRDEDIETLWSYYKDRTVAVIDRNNKKIIINDRLYDHNWILSKAIPDDYTVYKTYDDIPDTNILADTKACLRLEAKHRITDFVRITLHSYYGILYGNRVVLYNNINDLNKETYTHHAITKFIKANKLSKYDFYNECFDENYKLNYYTSSWKSKTVVVKFPTLKQIANNTIFTPKQKLLLEQKYFWSTYCRGNGISFKDVVSNWNKEVTYDDIVKYLKTSSDVNPEWFNKVCTWNDCISKRHEYRKSIRGNYVKKNLEISDNNYKEAVKQIQNNYSVEDWRNGKSINHHITYKRFVPSYSKNTSDKWVDTPLYNSRHSFSNVQLKLGGINNNTIYTSRYAAVPLAEGVKMYKLFVIARKNQPNRTNWTTSDFGNVMVGIYNLRFITYKDKVTDTGDKLGYKEWLIQIGCHSIWLDDVKEFIRYYHLEKEFGL